MASPLAAFLPLILLPVLSCGGGGNGVVDGAPVISSVTPGVFAGYPGRQVMFRADASGDPTSWSWDFGAGATPNNPTEARPTVLLGDSGSYTGTLTATNASGASQAFSFTYGIEVPVTPTFADVQVTSAPEPVAFEAVALGTKLAIAYRTGSELRVARANLAVPTTAADWQVHLVDQALTDSGVPGVGVANERLVLSYIAPDGAVKVAVSTGLTPASATDYAIHELRAGVAGIGQQVVVRNGKPVVGFLDGLGVAIIAVATVERPTAAQDWMLQSLTQDPGGEGLRITEVEGHPIAAWIHPARAELAVAVASGPSPMAEADWQVHAIAGAAEGLAIQGLRERLYLITGEGRENQTRFIISKGPRPAAATDYTELLLVDRRYGGPSSMAVIEGRLAFAIIAPDGRLNLNRALKLTLLHSSDFVTQALDPAHEASVLQLNERIVYGYASVDRKSLVAELGNGSW